MSIPLSAHTRLLAHRRISTGRANATFLPPFLPPPLPPAVTIGGVFLDPECTQMQVITGSLYVVEHGGFARERRVWSGWLARSGLSTPTHDVYGYSCTASVAFKLCPSPYAAVPRTPRGPVKHILFDVGTRHRAPAHMACVGRTRDSPRRRAQVYAPRFRPYACLCDPYTHAAVLTLMQADAHLMQASLLRISHFAFRDRCSFSRSLLPRTVFPPAFQARLRVVGLLEWSSRDRRLASSSSLLRPAWLWI
ncbi:hypothetical protein B0H10DRAFT_2230335 [Mycena sp. CBHHK59/15]|nr:hypothetical protein B0H10DRAFT_2230335 [Mycena sp. CBHHK59/15]